MSSIVRLSWHVQVGPNGSLVLWHDEASRRELSVWVRTLARTASVRAVASVAAAVSPRSGAARAGGRQRFATLMRRSRHRVSHRSWRDWTTHYRALAVVDRHPAAICSRLMIGASTHLDAGVLYWLVMRTTIDLPPDLHTAARELAHREGKTLSEVVAELVRRGLKPGSRVKQATNHAGLPTISVGRVVTEEDVRSLDEDV